MGRFKPRVLALAAEKFGVRLAEGDVAEIEVVFKRLSIHERIADEVKQLWDAGLKDTEIAKQVGFNRNIVAKAIAHWHASRGLAVPDGRHHVSRLKRQPLVAERIADDVMDLVSQDIPLKEITGQVNTDLEKLSDRLAALGGE